MPGPIARIVADSLAHLKRAAEGVKSGSREIAS